MSQKRHLLLAEDGLLHVDGEALLSQATKHLTKMLSMRSVVRARNQNVVKIDEGNPARTRSMKRWKVDPTFRKPKAIPTNTNRPIGVMTAVFGMLSGNISTW